MTIYGRDFNDAEIKHIKEILGFDHRPSEDFIMQLMKYESLNAADRRVTAEILARAGMLIKKVLPTWPTVKRSGERNIRRFRENFFYLLPLIPFHELRDLKKPKEEEKPRILPSTQDLN